MNSTEPALSQTEVDTFFRRHADYWQDVYGSARVDGEIYRERQARVLDWVRDLRLPSAAAVLEIGCGAGLLTLELARQFERVEAIDSVQEMVERTARNAHDAGLSAQVRAQQGMVEDLPFVERSFDLVIANGVLPWLTDSKGGIQSMAEMLKPGGSLLVTADNRRRLTHLLDPWQNPAVQPLKTWLRGRLKLGRQDISPNAYHTHAELRRLVIHAGLQPVRAATLGFGPFTFFYRTPFSPTVEIKVHRMLNQLANCGWPILRSTGTQILLLARKPVVTDG